MGFLNPKRFVKPNTLRVLKVQYTAVLASSVKSSMQILPVLFQTDSHYYSCVSNLIVSLCLLYLFLERHRDLNSNLEYA